MSVEMLRFCGDSRRLLSAGVVSESAFEVAGCWHPGDPGDVRLSEDIGVIVEVAI
jgi:Fe2+ transport system protein FeoA